jgi:hypothetical protein
LHPLNSRNAFPCSDPICLAEEIKGELGTHLNGLKRFSAHAVKDILDGPHVAIYCQLNQGPDDVRAIREAALSSLL